MTTSLKTIYGDATVTATAPDADGDISYRVCLANGTELSQLCWSQEIAQAKLAAMHDHYVEECARKAPGSAAAAAYHAGNERIVGAGPDES